MRRISLSLLVALGLFATALPASAGEALTWTDPKGDAGISPASGVTVPAGNEDSLDALGIRIQTVGDNIEWTIDLAKASNAAPTIGTGKQYRFSFVYKTDGQFNLTYVSDLTYPSGTELRGGLTGSANPLTCGRCLTKVDTKANRLTITTPISSLNAAMKGVDKKYAVTKGSKFESIKLTTARLISAVALKTSNLVADESAPVGNKPFTV